jgi:hypothetical protein
VVLTDASTTGHSNSDALVIYYEDQATGNVVSGTVTANPGTGAFTVSGTVGLDNASLVALENITVTVSPAVLGTVTISNFPATQTVAGTVTANVGNLPLATSPNNWETIGDQIATGLNAAGLNVDVASLPAISGTVTANVDASSLAVALDAFGAGYTNQLPVAIDQTGFGNVPISGTVTANLGNVQFRNYSASSVTVLAAHVGWGSNAGAFFYETTLGNPFPVQVVSASTVTVGNSVTIGSLPAISGTVTVGAMPNGALTTRFGSVTTANTAELTSAVTNTSRKYLLVQNIASATVTIGIGFAPTTTQGIQLTAGAGLTFDAFCPTGGVWWLSSTTGSNFSILEG